MPKVRIAYDPADMTRIGSTVDVTDDEARVLVRDGRAASVLATDELMAEKKAVLVDEAKARGVEVSPKASKAEIVEAIQGVEG